MNSNSEKYREGWRKHYQTQFSGSGQEYDYYEPAYEYGWGLRDDPRYRSYDWAQLEPEARATWEQRQPGTWEKIKDAVRYAWENVKDAVGA